MLCDELAGVVAPALAHPGAPAELIRSSATFQHSTILGECYCASETQQLELTRLWWMEDLPPCNVASFCERLPSSQQRSLHTAALWAAHPCSFGDVVHRQAMPFPREGL